MYMSTPIIIFILPKFFIVFILTYFFILKKTNFLTLYFHFLSSIKRNVQWPCCWILLPSTWQESQVTPYFWWIGGRKSVLSSGHQYFLGRESELLAFTKQGMGWAPSSALYSGFGHHPSGELEHRVILLGRGWEINSLLRHWAGNLMQVACFFGQEDGVEAKFPNHSVENSMIFSNCVGWI